LGFTSSTFNLLEVSPLGFFIILTDLETRLILWVSGIKEAYKGLLNGDILERVIYFSSDTMPRSKMSRQSPEDVSGGANNPKSVFIIPFLQILYTLFLPFRKLRTYMQYLAARFHQVF